MLDTLDIKANFYVKSFPITQDKDGFIFSDECDSLLFSSLVGCIPGIKVDIDKAFDEKTGMWQRRPCSKPCYPEHSKSTISRDMLLGLAYYAYCNHRLDITEQVITYALSHCFVMGEGLLSRTIMTPGLLSTYAWISYRLGGPSRPWLRYLPQIESKKVVGFRAHLSVLHILLRRTLEGKEDKYADLLKYHANRNPENALFLYAAGEVDKAYTILNKEEYFPSDRLPTSQDRKTAWLWNRDYGSDYFPDSQHNKKKIFGGGEFLFVHSLLNNKIL